LIQVIHQNKFNSGMSSCGMHINQIVSPNQSKAGANRMRAACFKL
jgi:hypothetical protein